MRKLVHVVAAVCAAALISTTGLSTALACGDHPKAAAADKKKPMPAKVTTASYKVEGMTCEGCAEKVKGLASTDGIVNVEVSVANKRVTIQFDAAKLDVAKVAKLISDLGYKAAAEA